MDMFLNYENGKVTIDCYRHVGATVTTVEDIIETCDNGEDGGALSASLNLWVEGNINDLWAKASDLVSRSEVEKFVATHCTMVDDLTRIGVDTIDLGFVFNQQEDFIDDYLDS